MIKHYECLDCKRTGLSHMLQLYHSNNPRFARLMCESCNSFNICRVDDRADKKYQINSDISSLYKPSDIDAMTEEERNLENFLFRIHEIDYQLEDILNKFHRLIRNMNQVQLVKPEIEKEIKEKLKEDIETTVLLIQEIYSIKKMVDK